ncbi:potassium transporter Kup [Methylomonas sp. MED-D]|uniref:Probable potassium transport system protein Kup n=1 Tax=Methylomonas koyamae TaxID=702114 RepID=A0A177NM00_9GAMM|nr:MULTISPECIES: potassium transporter Kup [Methylomonas]MDT4332864.1 potassium transporter Kup [Methylomonas sp. MV1]OAI18862.1 potassium transport protein Kup [Methylomonas koyamae]OHX34199.1 potassium transporter Kup [Methylomonas sp. LWB]
MPSKHPFPPKEKLSTLALSAIGVVFGDIGTSPLYAMKEVFHGGLPTDTEHVLGVLSLIFWSLTLVVSTKYATFIMRADNRGEGGIMALMALALRGARNDPRRKGFIVTLGLLGASLFYGDSIITPAISVLGAVEGLKVIAPRLHEYVVPAAIAVLSLLFILQVKGTGVVGRLFSPIMCAWFATLALLGIVNIGSAPEVLMAINPFHALHLLVEIGWKGFLIMGAIVLVITGAEALYADMGHFGLKPIRCAWFFVVFPALMLNYFGQGALLISDPSAIRNPFYLLAPNWAQYPLLILSTLTTVIASQAVISGAFSVTRQAIQLGYCPRMTVRHTSGYEMRQVYVPAINGLMAVCVFVLVLSFKSASALASAYGIAVTGTMIVDTVLAFIVIQGLWRWNRPTSIAFLSIFLSVDLLFLASNSLKIPTGGWLPLVVGAILFLVMTTWIKGRELLAKYLEDRRVLFEELEERLKTQPPVTVPGTAIYMARSMHGVPQVLLHNLEHNRVLHEKIIVLTIVTTEEPYVDESHRVKIRAFGHNRSFYRVKLYFGFQEEQDVRRALQLCCHEGLDINQKTVSFFIGSERLSFRRKSPMPKWRRSLFSFLTHNSTSAIEYFKIPVERVIELGIRIEL